jgi:CHAT domain-containing protein
MIKVIQKYWLFCWLFLVSLGLIVLGSANWPGLYQTGASLSSIAQFAAEPAVAAAPSTLPFIPPVNLEPLLKALDQGNIPNAVEQIEVGWKKQFEAYFEGKLTTQPLTSDGISQRLAQMHQLTGKKAAVIYVVPTPNQVELILLMPAASPVHRRMAAANQAALMPTVQTLRIGVVNPDSEASDYLPPAQQLYRWLIAPLEPDLQRQNIDTLIFCLGGGLRSVPIAALHDGKSFLIEKYRLAVMPAFNLADSRASRVQDTQVLAMGASEFQSQPPLPAVPVELSAIAHQIWQGKSFLNQEFTLENFKAQRAKYPYGIIHMATHAEFAPGSVEDSYIQFWDTQLKLDQVKRLDLRTPVVQLLVLSACKTALGNTRAELGFAGLAVQSGVKSAIASLWSVSDGGTLVLMSELYQRLKTASIKAEALQQSQIAMIRKTVNFNQKLAVWTRGGTPLPPELATLARTDISHPYYWAAFTLIGNPW